MTMVAASECPGNGSCICGDHTVSCGECGEQFAGTELNDDGECSACAHTEHDDYTGGRAPVTTDADMYDHLVSLLSSDNGLRVDNDPTAPLPWAVWLDDEIVGAGDSRTEALKDALLTAAGWAL